MLWYRDRLHLLALGARKRVAAPAKELNVYDWFTNNARRVIELARKEAVLLRHSCIGTEHILLGLMREEGSVAHVALRSFGVSLEDVRIRVQEMTESADTSVKDLFFAASAKAMFERSEREALQLGDMFISTEHFLLGLLRLESGAAHSVLQQYELDIRAVRSRVIDIRSGKYKYYQASDMRFDASAKRLLERAKQLALEHGDSEVTDRHVLVAALETVDCSQLIQQSSARS